MKAAAKTQKPKCQEEHANFTSWRLALLCGCTLLALAFLLGCVAWLQVISPGTLAEEDDMRPSRVQQVSTSRGMITDRSGCPLAVGVSVKAIRVGPKEVHDTGGTSVSDRWKALADVLNIPLDQPLARIDANPKGRFIYLARQIDPDMAEYIKKLKLPGIHLREKSRRYYPPGEVAAHLIDFTDVDSQGAEDVEKSFGKWLTGQPDERTVRKDHYDRVIESISSIDSQAIHNLTLDIGECLQALVYRELNNAVALNKAGSGSAVLVDANADEVPAMANSPSYNPNNLSSTPKETVRNRTITDMSEPGSTVKPMVAMTALQRDVMRENSVLNTVPCRINGHEVKDVTRYSGLTLIRVLQKSNNVGVSKLALVTPSSALVDAYSRFGLGKVANLGLVGERNGLYPQEQRWSDIERATFFFDYGLMVTPSQLARVCATIDSYGIYHPLSITKVDPPAPGRCVFPEPIVRTVVHMIESVALPGGGDVKAVIKGYRTTIKTGIMKKVGPDDRYINKYIAYTVGIAPASQPRLVLVVIINNPQAGKHYGGAVSTPVFGAIMGGILRTMSIEPDALVTGDKNELAINQGEDTGGRL